MHGTNNVSTDKSTLSLWLESMLFNLANNEKRPSYKYDYNFERKILPIHKLGRVTDNTEVDVLA